MTKATTKARKHEERSKKIKELNAEPAKTQSLLRVKCEPPPARGNKEFALKAGILGSDHRRCGSSGVRAGQLAPAAYSANAGDMTSAPIHGSGTRLSVQLPAPTAVDPVDSASRMAPRGRVVRVSGAPRPGGRRGMAPSGYATLGRYEWTQRHEQRCLNSRASSAS